MKKCYPLPAGHELADPTKGATGFTGRDLKNGYKPVTIANGEEWKTAFMTKYGHLEYMVMLFGRTNALATFQAIMNTICPDQLGNGVVIYSDNILIYSQTCQEHTAWVKKIF